MWREQLFGAGTLGVVAAFLGVAVFFALITVITSRRLAGAARQVTAALGPDPAATLDRLGRLSPAARSIRPAVQRLDRAWREHAARTEAQFAAAEAVISAVPDPLILIDHSAASCVPIPPPPNSSGL